MGIFDFLKKNKNIVDENGLNEVYTNNGKGVLQARFYKKNGKLNGLYQTFALSTEFHKVKLGQLRKEEIWKENKLEGLSKSFDWNGSGKLINEGYWKAGMKDGIWKYYYAQGERVFKNANNAGEFKVHPNFPIPNSGKRPTAFGKNPSFYYSAGGPLKLEQNFKCGKKDGIWKWYYESGQLSSTEIYKNGQFIESITYNYDKNGQLIKEKAIPDWYKGSVSEKGSTEIDLEGNKFNLSPSEKSIYEYTMFMKELLSKMNNKAITEEVLNSSIYQDQIDQLELGKSWLLSNNIKAYNLIFKEGSLSEKETNLAGETKWRVGDSWTEEEFKAFYSAMLVVASTSGSLHQGEKEVIGREVNFVATLNQKANGFVPSNWKDFMESSKNLKLEVFSKTLKKMSKVKKNIVLEALSAIIKAGQGLDDRKTISTFEFLKTFLK